MIEIGSICKNLNRVKVFSKNLLYFFRRAIACLQKDKIWGRAVQYTHIKKIMVFTDYGIMIIMRVFPNFNIRLFIKIYVFRMNRIWENIRKQFWKSRGKIRVKKQFQSNNLQTSSFSICKISKTSKNIFLSKLRKIIQNLFNRHSRCKIIQNVIYSNSESSDTRSSTFFAGLYCDNFFVIDHDFMVFNKMKLSSEKRSRGSWTYSVSNETVIQVGNNLHRIQIFRFLLSLNLKFQHFLERLEFSCSENFGDGLAFSGKLQSGKNMFALQFRKVFQDLFITHSRTKPSQNINNSDSCSFNTWLTRTDIRIIRNIVSGFLSFCSLSFYCFRHTNESMIHRIFCQDVFIS